MFLVELSVDKLLQHMCYRLFCQWT